MVPATCNAGLFISDNTFLLNIFGVIRFFSGSRGSFIWFIRFVVQKVIVIRQYIIRGGEEPREVKGREGLLA